MHIPSPELRQEMLAVPQLVRFTFPYQDDMKRHPTLIIKAHTLLLKYIVQGASLNLFFFRTKDSHCAYALHVADDPANGVMLWSLIADCDELAAIGDLAIHGRCTAYLFNELCVNCAWTSVNITISAPVLALATGSILSDRNPKKYIHEVGQALDRIHLGSAREAIQVEIAALESWKALSTNFILNGARGASLNLLNDNEGSHQEQIAHALLGDLSPRGAYVNTQLHESIGNKEFIDVLLGFELGTILIESKSISLLSDREFLPDRNKLRRNIKKSSEKALSQLSGAVRTLKKRIPIFDSEGDAIELEFLQPIHAIILVPELDLMNDDDFWLSSISKFREKSDAFLHILDTAQLFRTMQAAQMISEVYSKITAINAFDYYLRQRADAVLKSKTIKIDMMLSIK